MPATQPIPQNEPNSASKQASDVLALHNNATNARTRNPARWDPPTRRSTVTGENAGRRVSK